MFGEVIEFPENAEYIAKIIIERLLKCKIKKISVVPEKQLAYIDSLRVFNIKAEILGVSAIFHLTKIKKYVGDTLWERLN